VKKLTVILLLALLLTAVVVMTASAVGGAAFTTFNPAVDGEGKDICKNSAINCNIYGAKKYVWLNGGPDANHLKPDGYYFFAVLEPGGQPNPNDQGGVADKNLSDDFDFYTDRTFKTEGGEVVEYNGPHDLDSGTGPVCKSPQGCDPDGEPPLIRLFPYTDTTNPGGVYIMAICYIGADGNDYPVAPRDCKYDAFKVREGRVQYEFLLEGLKYHDLNASGAQDGGELGLPQWEITINGTGFANEIISESVFTGNDGSWSFGKQYSFKASDPVYTAVLEVCEVLQDGWVQSEPSDPSCYQVELEPSGVAYRGGLDFGNWQPVDVTACKVKDLDGNRYTEGDHAPVAGWPVYLSIDYNTNGELDEGEIVDGPQYTLEDGCYTWPDLEPGKVYNVEEGHVDGWVAFSDTVHFFDEAVSGQSYSFTFVNAPVQGCTPGFWQGGPDKPDAKSGGALLWDGLDIPPGDGPGTPPPFVDPQWISSGGYDGNPYIHVTRFHDFFSGSVAGDLTMFDLVGTGGGSLNWQKAARSLVAAYLNASWGMAYAYTVDELVDMWDTAVANPDDPDVGFLALHTALDAANNYYYSPYGSCPISASNP
jgi:hypothetical protein